MGGREEATSGSSFHRRNKGNRESAGKAFSEVGKFKWGVKKKTNRENGYSLSSKHPKNNAKKRERKQKNPGPLCRRPR